jgi:hypothetical protein
MGLAHRKRMSMAGEKSVETQKSMHLRGKAHTRKPTDKVLCTITLHIVANLSEID